MNTETAWNAPGNHLHLHLNHKVDDFVALHKSFQVFIPLR